jgi:uncharacterized protein DUF6788
LATWRARTPRSATTTSGYCGGPPQWPDTQRRTRCGRRNCGCHADPPRLHGPYWQWTRKVAAKTIGRWLSDGQHRDYQGWIDNDRRLHELLARLEALGTAALEADPRWER